jgi:hypothetical protein
MGWVGVRPCVPLVRFFSGLRVCKMLDNVSAKYRNPGGQIGQGNLAIRTVETLANQSIPNNEAGYDQGYSRRDDG